MNAALALEKLMKLLHYEKFEVNSKLKPREIIVLLGEHTVRKELPGYYNKEFSGVVKNDSFKIYKNTTYYNGSAAIIIGRVHASKYGSKISITMRPNIFVLLFMYVWIFYVLIACIMELFSIDRAFGFSFVPFGMLSFGVIMFSGFFWYEVSKLKIKLTQLLKQLTKKVTRVR